MSTPAENRPATQAHPRRPLAPAPLAARRAAGEESVEIPSLAPTRSAPPTLTFSPPATPPNVPASILVPAARAHHIASTIPVIASVAPASSVGITRHAAPTTQAVPLAATTQLTAATTQTHAAITKIHAAIPKPRSGSLRPTSVASFTPNSSSQRPPLPVVRSLNRASQPKPLWRRAKSCALCSNPAARVRRRAFPFPVAGGWQNQRFHVSTAARFGDALKRRRNCHLTAPSATGFLPWGTTTTRSPRVRTMTPALRPATSGQQHPNFPDQMLLTTAAGSWSGQQQPQPRRCRCRFQPSAFNLQLPPQIYV